MKLRDAFVLIEMKGRVSVSSERKLFLRSAELARIYKKK